MLSFEPTEDQKLMVESVAHFARTTLRPHSRSFESQRSLPPAVLETAHSLGLGLALVPTAYGGAGLTFTTAVLLEEEIGWADAAAGFAFAGPGPFGLAVVELGTAEQARATLEPYAGADGASRVGAVAWGERRANAERPGLTTMATKVDGGYRLDGEKAYVVNAERADRFVVFAQVDPNAGWAGIGAFIVDAKAPGLSVLPREKTLGLDAVSFGGIGLSSVFVTDDVRLLGGESFDAALIRFFARHALVVAARGVGLARAAFEVTREYVDDRRAFGKPIGHFQAIAFTVADRAMDVDAGRALVWRAAAAWDAYDAVRWELATDGETKAPPRIDERECLLRTAQAVAFVHEAAMRCGDDGVQLHGGAGFMRDYLVEKFMRDAKQLGLCAMTAEHADQLAAVVELERPLDVGLVLPTSETQNAFV